MATVGSQTNWSQASKLGTWTANSSRKVIMWATGPSSLLQYMALGVGSQQFDAGHSEIYTGFLPEGVNQWGNFHFKCLPCWLFPFPSMCCLTNPLQCMGVGHKPVWLPHALCHFFLGHELADVEDSWGGWANVHSPTGSHSDVTELLPPSITSTPLGLAHPRQWRTTSDESRQSLASIYTSPNFNIPGYPAVGPGNLTPTVPSIAGSHHVSSTWPPSVFTSRSSSPHLTIDQGNSIFKLGAECQVLGVKLAKEFQVLSGLGAMHCNSIQGTAHETLTLGCLAWEATYSAILRDKVSKAECKAMTHCLHSEADTTWKEMHEVMYNHQLHYDRWLSAFLTDTEMTLNNMRDEVWATIYALAENEGIMFDACLGLALQVLNLLPQIPVNISFQAQIPLTIAYCLESSIYRRWHPEQGSVSPLCKEVRASHTLSKVLGGVTHQPSEGVDHPPSPAASDNSVGSGRTWGSRHRSCSHAQSITPACSWQSGSVGSVAGHHSLRSHATEGCEVSSSESDLSHDEEDAAGEDENAEADKGGVETSSNGQVASDGEEGQECPQTQDTLTSISQVFGTHDDTYPESNPGEKIQSVWQKRCPKSPKEYSPPRNPVNHLLRKSHPQMRHSTMRPGKELSSWTHVLMLGVAKRLLKVSWAGPPETP